MKTCYAMMTGRFGNQLFTYAHVRAQCEAKGIMLITAPWVGEKLFKIEPTWRIAPEKCDMYIRDYCQMQRHLIYTREQVRGWFQFREPYQKMFDDCKPEDLLAHRRVGDYAGAGFVVVSEKSYKVAAKAFGYDPDRLVFVTEENPTRWGDVDDDVAFLPDFIRMMKAKVLFRGNSSFSWWASALGDAKTYSPVIDGLCGGKEQDCDFVEGNHARTVELDFVTELRL